MKKAALILSLCAALASAQEFRSTLSGRVVDQQQAVVPGVQVTAVQTETGARMETVSGHDGQFTLPFLLPGTYEVSAVAQGFKHYIRSGMVLSANERKAIDIALEVGALSESVTVTAQAPLLDTSSGSVGQVLSSEQVENIPLNGRNPLMMAQLWPGVTPQGGPVLTRPFDVSHTSDMSIAGAPPETNELLMDGTPNTVRAGRISYNPPMDAVLEVKVEAFQTDAAYGNTGGGTINLISKGGGNDYHGAAYYYNQVARLAATPFFINRSGQQKPFMLWNQFGVTAGGPVLVPKLFNGRDRLFFYFAYEGIRQPNPNPLATTVPTEAMRKGDFSSLLAISTSYQIYDPLSGVREGSRVRRQPLAGNVIPARLLSPVAQKFLQYWPPPNQPGGVDGRNNFFGNAAQQDNWDNHIGRLDFNWSPRHKLFFSTRHNTRNSYEQAFFHNIARGRRFLRDAWGAMVDDVVTLTPTTVLNTRLNWGRFVEVRRLLSTGLNITELGFPASLAAASPLPVLPRIDIDRFGQLSDSNHNITPWDSFQIFTSLSKVLNRHSLKLGADARLYRESNYSPSNSAGRYQFSTNWTRGPLDSSPGSPLGQDFASFLLGLPTGGSFDLNAFRSNQSGYLALFLQDDFRVRADLTLNLGLRWEKETPTTERFNRAVNGFDPAAALSITAAARAAYAKNPIPEVSPQQFNPVGGILFAGPGRREAYQTRSANFSPRIGFAWTPAALGRKTVFRGGGGVFFFDLGMASTIQTGFSQTTPYVTTLDGYLTPYTTLSNPFPVGILQPTGSALGVDTYLGRGVSFYNPKPLNAYSVRWNLSIQRLVAGEMMVEAGYLGNHSVHLGVDRALNFTPRQYLSVKPERDQAAIDFLSASVPNPFANLLAGTGLNGGVTTRSQLLNVFPQFTGVTRQADNEGGSYAHTLFLKADKRFSRGFQMQAALQYSRIMQRLNRLDDSDPYLEKRVPVENVPWRLVTSGIYNLPFGQGRGFLNQVIGGWIASGVFTIDAGHPLEWGNVIYLGGDLGMDPTNIDRAFDTTRFDTNARQQLGRNLRTFPTTFSNLRSAGVNSLDLSAIKNFPLRERLKLQFRCEFFNAFNHVQFGAPDVSPTSSTFGRIVDQANLPRRIQMALRLVW